MIVNVSLGLQLPPSSPSGSGCLSLANSVLSFVLCTGLVVSYARAFCTIAIPQSGLLAQVSSLWLGSGHSSPILKKHCSPCLPAQPPLASGGCSRMRCFSTGGVSVGLVICRFKLFIYFLPCYVALWASKSRHRLGSESVSWCLETFLFLRLPSQDEIAAWDRAPYRTFLSLFSSFTLFPTCF